MTIFSNRESLNEWCLSTGDGHTTCVTAQAPILPLFRPISNFSKLHPFFSQYTRWDTITRPGTTIHDSYNQEYTLRKPDLQASSIPRGHVDTPPCTSKLWRTLSEHRYQ